MTRSPAGWMGIFKLVAIALALVTCSVSCGHPPTGSGVATLNLVWQDEFEGPAGQSPDAQKWTYDVGGSGWGNSQLEYDTNRPENVSLDGNGNLVIVARKEAYLGRAYTSARINTRGLFQQVRGRFEARIRMPSGGGLWPAFWLLGANIDEAGWPACGEIDIMEYRGQEPGIVHGSLHGPGYSGGSSLTGPFELRQGTFDGGFHVFAIDWDADRIAWLVDGVAYRSVTPAALPAGTRWVFDHPFFIILNVAVGGNYVGPPSSSTTFPQTMTVDYVRAYAVGP